MRRETFEDSFTTTRALSAVWPNATLAVNPATNKIDSHRFTELFQAFQVLYDRFGVVTVELVRRHGRIGGVSAGTKAGLEKLRQALLAPSLPKAAAGCEVGRSLVPFLH